jgi:hypothetical protein
MQHARDSTPIFQQSCLPTELYSMNHTPSFRASFGRSLSQRLDRLGSTLTDLRDRMRDGIAQAVAVAAADAVRAVTRVLLGTPPNRDLVPKPSWSPTARSSLWNEPDEMPNEDRFTDYSEDEEDLLDDEPPAKATEPSRVRNALALGCEGAAWWLRRSACGYALTAIAIGLVCVAAAFLVGNHLAGSVLSLATLADLMRSSTDLLARISTS